MCRPVSVGVCEGNVPIYILCNVLYILGSVLVKIMPGVVLVVANVVAFKVAFRPT